MPNIANASSGFGYRSRYSLATIFAVRAFYTDSESQAYEVWYYNGALQDTAFQLLSQPLSVVALS